MEPTRKKPSGLLAVALGITTAVASVGLLSDYMPGNSAFAQNYQQPNAQVSAVQQPMMQNVQTAAPIMQQQPMVNPAAILQQSNQLLIASRTSLAGGDVVTAEQQLQQAVALNAPYTERDDRPEYIKPLIDGHKNWLQAQKNYGNADQVRRMRAENLAYQADGFYRHNNLDMAEKLAHDAMAQNVSMSSELVQTGRDPQSILKRINDVKLIAASQNNTLGTNNGSQVVSAAVQQQAQEMLPHLNRGYQLLQAGQIGEAEKVAQYLLAQNVPDSAFATAGNTPTQLMVDIARARQQVAGQNAGVMHPVYNPALDSSRNIVSVQGTVPSTVPGGMPTTMPTLDRAPAATVGDMSRQAAEQEFVAAIQQQITRSQQLMSEDIPKMNDAITNLTEARAKVESSEISPDMKRSLLIRLDRELGQMEEFRARHGSAIEMAQNNADVHAALEQERAQRAYVEMKLKEFTDEFNALYKQERYAEAMAVAEKARAIAPKEVVVAQMENQSKIAYRQQTMDQIKREKEQGVLNAFIDQERSSILSVNDTTPLVGPDANYWLNATKRADMGMLSADQSEVERSIYLALEKPISLNTNGTQPLRVVVDRLKQETGININIDNQAIADKMETTASDVMVELDTFNEIKFKSALNQMLRPLGLSYTVRDEALVITSPKNSRSEMTYKAYYVADLVMERPDNRRHRPKTGRDRFRDAMQTALGRQTGFSVNSMQAPITQVSMRNNINDMGNMSRIPDSIMPQIMSGGAYVPAGGPGMAANRNGSAGGGADFGELIDLIQEVIDPPSWRDGGYGGTGSRRSSSSSTPSITSDTSEDTEEEGEATIRPFYNTLTLIIRQTEDNHQQIQELLTQLRKMNDIQISVEVRFITIKDDFFESMGVDFDVNFRNSQGTKYAGLNSGSTDTGTTGTDTEEGQQNSTAFTQAVKNAKLIAGLTSAGTTKSPNFSSDLGMSLDQGSIGLTLPAFGGYQPTAGTSFGFAILSDIETYFFMNAAQGDSRSNVLQAPKVMLINGQYGTVYDTTERYFVTGVIPVVGDFAVAQQPIIEIIEEGTELSVQAVVSSDRRYVRMNLAPYFSTIGDTVSTFTYDGSSSISSSSGTGTGTGSGTSGETVESSSSGTTVQQPLITEFGVETSVSVPDGGTILLGGVKRLSEGRKEFGVPMINKIPYLKRLFANTAVGRETQSMMMMVTPHIIIQEEFEQSMSSAVEN